MTVPIRTTRALSHGTKLMNDPVAVIDLTRPHRAVSHRMRIAAGTDLTRGWVDGSNGSNVTTRQANNMSRIEAATQSN